MAITLTLDAQSVEEVGLLGTEKPGIKRVLAVCNLGNPYAAGGIALTGAALKIALDAAYGTSVPTCTIDTVEVLGPSIDGTLEARWTPATGKMQAFTQGVACSGAATADTLTGGTPMTLTHVTERRNIDAITGIATLSGIAVGGINLTAEAAGAYHQLVILPTGVVPAHGQVAYTQATGSLKFRVLDAFSTVWCWYDTRTAGANAVFTPGAPITFVQNVLPAEYGAVDLSSALKSVQVAIDFHF